MHVSTPLFNIALRVLAILLYGYERWILNDDIGRRIHVVAFDNLTLLQIRYTEHTADAFVRQIINITAYQKELPRHRKLTRCGPETCYESLVKGILRGIAKDNRRIGRQCKSWLDNIIAGISQPMNRIWRMETIGEH